MALPFRIKPLAAALYAAGLGHLAPAPAQETRLPEVEVRDQRERESPGYQGGTTSVGKLPQLPRDIPQAVTIVPEKLMVERNADSFREALRVVPSLTFNAGEGGRIGDNITLRGYSVVGDLYLDGMRDVAQYNREMFNLEQVDVLRGSASMLFGRGSTGGVINQASKTPQLWDRYSAAVTAGSYNYKRATADLNKRLAEDAALRLNVMKTESDSSRDEVRQKRSGIAPSVRFGIGTPDEVTLALYHLEYRDVPDYGVPYFRGLPLNVPVNTFYGMANADHQDDRATFLTGTHRHRFNADTELKTVLRRASYSRDLWAVAPRLAGAPAVITPATVINRQAQRRAGDEETFTLQSDLATKFATGALRHQLVGGVEVLREDAARWSWANGGANPPTAVGDPNPYPVLPANFFNVTRANQVSYQAATRAAYAQDIVEFLPGWKLLAGARYDLFAAEYNRPAPQGDLARTDRVWSWRTGLMRQPSDYASYYLSYGTSFNPSGEFYALDDRTANTPPEENRNLEAGAKWELFGGDLSLRTALFRTEKYNERNTDLSIPNLSLLSGKRHTDGVEIEAAGRITGNWEVFGAIAFLSARIDAASGQQAGAVGKTPVNTPDQTFNLWSTYRLGGGWKVGGGVEAIASRYGNATNTNLVPGYKRTDAMLAYESRPATLRLNVLNLFDKPYYEGVYQGHVIPGTLRAVQLTLEMKYY